MASCLTDLIAIPDFSAGAMENWGLITYRLTALLYDKDKSSDSNKQWVAVVVAHELAHQVCAVSSVFYINNEMLCYLLSTYIFINGNIFFFKLTCFSWCLGKYASFLTPSLYCFYQRMHKNVSSMGSLIT